MDFSIEAILEEEIDPVLEMCSRLFTEAVGEYYPELFFYLEADFSISRKAVLDGEIIGCYLLSREKITSHDFLWFEDLGRYEGCKALHGVALGILPEYRGLGLGRQLRDAVMQMEEVDYIWGYQVYALNNLENWLSHGRRRVGVRGRNHVTLMDRQCLICA